MKAQKLVQVTLKMDGEESRAIVRAVQLKLQACPCRDPEPCESCLPLISLSNALAGAAR